MIFLGIHIAGWALILLIALSLFMQKEFFRNFLEIFKSKNLKLFMKNIFVALLSILTLFLFYYSSKSVPFKRPPKLHKEVLNYVESEKVKTEPEFERAIAFCGAGNIYRCLCELNTITTSPLKERLQIRKIIIKGMLKQKESRRFLK